jgi:hypothetical protein
VLYIFRKLSWRCSCCRISRTRLRLLEISTSPTKNLRGTSTTTMPRASKHFTHKKRVAEARRARTQADTLDAALQPEADHSPDSKMFFMLQRCRGLAATLATADAASDILGRTRIDKALNGRFNDDQQIAKGWNLRETP